MRHGTLGRWSGIALLAIVFGISGVFATAVTVVPDTYPDPPAPGLYTVFLDDEGGPNIEKIQIPGDCDCYLQEFQIHLGTTGDNMRASCKPAFCSATGSLGVLTIYCAPPGISTGDFEVEIKQPQNTLNCGPGRNQETHTATTINDDETASEPMDDNVPTVLDTGASAPVPAMSWWGSILLAVLLLAGGSYVILRRRQATSTTG